MDKQKIVIVLLIAAILFSLASVYITFSSNTDNLIPAQNTNTVTTIEGDRGNVAVQILSPSGGTG